MQFHVVCFYSILFDSHSARPISFLLFYYPSHFLCSTVHLIPPTQSFQACPAIALSKVTQASVFPSVSPTLDSTHCLDFPIPSLCFSTALYLTYHTLHSFNHFIVTQSECKHHQSRDFYLLCQLLNLQGPGYSRHSINIYGMNEKISECTYRLKVIKQQNVRVETKIFREGEN